MKKDETVFVLCPQGRVPAGQILVRHGEKIFLRRIRQKNIFRALDGIPFLEDGIRQAQTAGCTWIEAFDTLNGIRYRIRLLDFFRYAIRKNFGYGEQMICSRKYFTKVSEGQGNLF